MTIELNKLKVGFKYTVMLSIIFATCSYLYAYFKLEKYIITKQIIGELNLYNFILNHTDSQVYLKIASIIDKTNLTYFTSDIIIYFIVYFFILIVPIIYLGNKFFEFINMDKKDHSHKIRGASIIDSFKLAQLIKKDYKKYKKYFNYFINLNKTLLLPYDLENRSIFVTGSSGSGKSSLLKNIIAEIDTRQNDKMLILDRKPEFINLFYRENHDYLFYPRDQNSLKWDFGNEIKSRDDIRFVVESLIVITEDEKQPVFPLAAQLILEAILLYLLDHDRLSNKGLIDFFRTYRNELKLKKALEPTMEKYAINLDSILSGDGNFTKSVFATIVSMFQKQFIIEDFYYENKDFSLKDYFKEDGDKRIFLVNRKQESNLYNAYHVLFLSFWARNILSLENNTKKRIWTILDEFQSLKTTNNKGLESIKELLKEGRQKGSSMILLTQELAQVEALYKKTGLSTILGNTATKVFLQTIEPNDQKLISEFIGYEEVAEFNSSAYLSQSGDNGANKTNINKSTKEKKIIMPSELGDLKIVEKHNRNGIYMDIEAYIKIGHYPVSKINYQTQNFESIYEIKQINIERGFEKLVINEEIQAEDTHIVENDKYYEKYNNPFFKPQEKKEEQPENEIIKKVSSKEIEETDINKLFDTEPIPAQTIKENPFLKKRGDLE